jgi:hypothetical protein
MNWALKRKYLFILIQKKIKNVYDRITLLNMRHLKLYINKSKPGTFWYVLLNSHLFFLLRAFTYFFGVLFILLIFSIYKLFKQHESLFVFLYIIWFFSSLFYIEFLRV